MSTVMFCEIINSLTEHEEDKLSILDISATLDIGTKVEENRNEGILGN
ncbi:hypothetical protein [Bacillus proteolyticus]|nr:hypothetical protein [Bacillus proteolyticus]